jgi:aldose 1-epimerase
LTDREWLIRHANQQAVVNARGGALRSYQVAGEHVVDGWSDGELPPAFNGAVLAPWPNRIRDGRWRWRDREQSLPLNEVDRRTALHGLLIWVDWELRDRADDMVQLGCRIAAQPGYPFDLDVSVRWSLTARGLQCDLAAENAGADPAPFGIGTHPLFGFANHRVDELTLHLPAGRQVLTDDRLLPVGLAGTDGRYDGCPLTDVVLDAAFTDLRAASDGGFQVRLESPSGTITVWADRGFPWWQVYTSDMFDRDDDRYRRSVAIEAMTCGPDAFNSGEDVVVLEPGGSWSGSWGVRRS